MKYIHIQDVYVMLDIIKWKMDNVSNAILVQNMILISNNVFLYVLIMPILIQLHKLANAKMDLTWFMVHVSNAEMTKFIIQIYNNVWLDVM